MALNLQCRALRLAGIAADGSAETQLILNLDLKAKEKPLFYWQKCHSWTLCSDYGKRLRESTHNPFFGYLALILSEVTDYIREEQRPHTSFSCVSTGNPGGAGDPLCTEPLLSHRAAHVAGGPGLDHFSSNSPQKRITSVFWNSIPSCPQYQLELAL